MEQFFRGFGSPGEHQVLNQPEAASSECSLRLTDVIGLEWHKTHLEACRWEHVISDDVEARLVVLLGNPSTCPHGNPIPGGPAPKSSAAEGAAEVAAVVRLRQLAGLDGA